MIVPFFAFRIMVGLGLLMLGVVALGWMLAAARAAVRAAGSSRPDLSAAPLGFLAVLAGWTTTEVGRQPWTVYGLMRTADSVTPSLTGGDVALSLAGYIVVYLIMFLAGCLHGLDGARGVDDGAGSTTASAQSAAGGAPAAPGHAQRCPPARRERHDPRSRAGLDADPGLGGVLLCRAGRLRSGRRHSLQFRAHAPTAQAMMNSIAPIWDGNETWLVLGGLGLLAAFPLAFAIILPAVYFPILVMLLALVFRGVAFEFRFRDAEHRPCLGLCFLLGSAVATFAQGIVLGAFIQGFEVEGRHFAGGSFDCFTPFSLFTGVALMFGYGLLGAGWLILKTEGALQERARRAGRDAASSAPSRSRGAACGRRCIDPTSRGAGFPGPTSCSCRRCRWPPPLAASGVARARRATRVAPFLYAIRLFLCPISASPSACSP